MVNSYRFSEQEIIESIKICLKVSDKINADKQLVSVVYQILKQFFIENNKYIILDAPTGAGKTIIGFMVFFCIQYLIEKSKDKKLQSIDGRILNTQPIGYYLTSAKSLQEQIENDLDKFDFHNWINMLKGQSNYLCPLATEKAIEEDLKTGFSNKNTKYLQKMFTDRLCRGTTAEERSNTEHDDFCKFHDNCPYINARSIASESSCAVMNYAYFLNSFRLENNLYFSERPITICDETHLIPDIVCNIFNTEINPNFVEKTLKLANNIENTFGSAKVNDLKNYLLKSFKIFENELTDYKLVLDYQENITNIHNILSELSKDLMLGLFKNDIKKLLEQSANFLVSTEDLKHLFYDRFEDVYFESELVENEYTKRYKHIIKDLSESELVKKHFLDKTNYCLFMSATPGDFDEFVDLMGLPKNSYIGIKLKSTFDFSKSPIYLCNSGYLNYKNFNSNIDKVLIDTLKIVLEFHPKEKGIIHTSTFKISNLLQEKIKHYPNSNRFLFYSTSKEKEANIELIKNSELPYVLVGPSLYEGIDLKNEMGRFNILVKVPYSALTGYTEKKAKRYHYWYNRITKEKIIQAIGRTNRNKNDYSKVYLMDSLFNKIIFDCGDIIIERLENKRIY